MSQASNKDSFGARSILPLSGDSTVYYRLDTLTEQGVADISKLPYSIKVLLESVLRNENGREIVREDILSLVVGIPGLGKSGVGPLSLYIRGINDYDFANSLITPHDRVLPDIVNYFVCQDSIFGAGHLIK